MSHVLSQASVSAPQNFVAPKRMRVSLSEFLKLYPDCLLSNRQEHASDDPDVYWMTSASIPLSEVMQPFPNRVKFLGVELQHLLLQERTTAGCQGFARTSVEGVIGKGGEIDPPTLKQGTALPRLADQLCALLTFRYYNQESLVNEAYSAERRYACQPISRMIPLIHLSLEKPIVVEFVPRDMHGASFHFLPVHRPA